MEEADGDCPTTESLADRQSGEVGDAALDPWRRLTFPGASSSLLKLLSADGGRNGKWFLCALRWLQGGTGGRGAAMTTDDRRGAADAQREITDRALDLVDVVGFSGVFGRGGGLQSLRLCDGTMFGGNGDGDNAGLGPWARRLSGDAERLTSDADISCADREERNGFNMSARALGNASATVERYVVRVVRKRRGDAAATIPSTV